VILTQKVEMFAKDGEKNIHGKQAKFTKLPEMTCPCPGRLLNERTIFSSGCGRASNRGWISFI